MFACNRLHVPRLHGDADRAAHKSVAIQSTGTLSSDGGCQFECARDHRYTGAYLFGVVCPARPRWTVAWFVGDAAMAALDRTGLLARNAPGGTDPLDAEWPDPDWIPEARALLPPDGAYLPTGLILAGVFVTRHTAPAPSTAWPALPQVAGGVGLVSPVASGTAYPVLSATMVAAGGIEAGHALLRALRSQGLGVFAANPLLVAQGSVKNLGRYAASWIAGWTDRPSSTAALTWSTRWAPQGDQRICRACSCGHSPAG